MFALEKGLVETSFISTRKARKAILTGKAEISNM